MKDQDPVFQGLSWEKIIQPSLGSYVVLSGVILCLSAVLWYGVHNGAVVVMFEVVAEAFALVGGVAGGLSASAILPCGVPGVCGDCGAATVSSVYSFGMPLRVVMFFISEVAGEKRKTGRLTQVNK